MQDTSAKKTTEYPLEVKAVKRQTKALAVSASFERAKSADGDIPLAVYDRNFSRITIAALEFGENASGTGKHSASANIRIPSLAKVFAATDLAFGKHITAPAQAGTSSQGPAYTCRLTGKFKGRTPAEVLSNDTDGYNALSAQYSWLQENLSRYPKNAEQMNAICDAMNLFNAGKLGKVEAAEQIVIYHSDSRALVRKKRADGMCPVYGLDIVWTVGAESPVSITVDNYYAPVTEHEGGRITPISSQMDRNTRVRIQMDITDEEWLDTVRCIKTAMSIYETANARECVEDALSCDRANRTAREKGTSSDFQPQQAQPQAAAGYFQPQQLQAATGYFQQQPPQTYGYAQQGYAPAYTA